MLQDTPTGGDAERAAIEGLVDRHGPWLVSWFRRRAPAGADPEDLAQEALLVLCRRADLFARPVEVGPFLLEVARRLVLAAGRQAGKRFAVLDPDGAAAGEPTCMDEERARLAGAVRSLPEELQQVIDVYYARDVTYEETAAVLGISRATVQSRLRRALTLLRQRLGNERTKT